MSQDACPFHVTFKVDVRSNIQVIANGNTADTTTDAQRKAFAQLVRTIVGDAAITFTEEGADIVAAVRRMVQNGANMVIAGGGDGTVSAVASVLVGTRIKLGVLPIGTLNHFAKDLGIPLDIESALQVLADDHAIDVDVGQVNDRIFVNNSGLGLYPDMVSNREQRQKEGNSKWPAVVLESARALAQYRRLTLRIELRERVLQRRAPAVFIGNNEYVIEGRFAARRHSLSEGQLALYVPHHSTRLRLIWFSLRALFGIPRQDSEFDRLLTDKFVIESRQKRVRVSLDGEVVEMQTPLKYVSRAGALRVIVPFGVNG